MAAKKKSEETTEETGAKKKGGPDMSGWTKEQKFKHLAGKRVNTTLKLLKTVGKLGNRGLYSYDEKDVEKIFGALQAALDKAKKAYDAKSPEAETEFSL